MRDIEEASTEETASVLGIRQQTVKTSLHRARRMLRVALGEHIGAALKDAFPFNRPRCDRLVEKVLDQLGFTFAKSVTPESLEVTSTRRQESAEARMAPAVKRVDE